MSDLMTYTCTGCADQFKAHPDANAADTLACSPRCHSAMTVDAPSADAPSIISKIKSLLG